MQPKASGVNVDDAVLELGGDFEETHVPRADDEINSTPNRLKNLLAHRRPVHARGPIRAVRTTFRELP